MGRIKVQSKPIWHIFTGTLVWLVIITTLHFWFNYSLDKRKVITLGYMPVITNLSAPLLDHFSRNNESLYFKAVKFSSFAEMAEALRHSEIDAAFMIAPLSIVLRQQGEDVKVVYIGNRHESTLVARADLNVDTIDDLMGKTVAVPMRYSGHNLALLKEIDQGGIEGRIKIVEMNPPDMASALATGSLDAYFVGEPFASQTVKSGDATIVHLVEDIWPNFICNLLLVRHDFIQDDQDTMQILVSEAVRAGFWAEANPLMAADIASRYWNQPEELVLYALTVPKGRIQYNNYIPQKKELQKLANLMVQFDLIEDNNISGLIDDSFAKKVGSFSNPDLLQIIPDKTVIKQ